MIQVIEKIFFYATWSVCLSAIFSYVAFFLWQKIRCVNIASQLLLMAFVLQTAFIILRIIKVHHPPLHDLFEYLSTFVWFTMLASIFTLHRTKEYVLGTIFSIIIFILQTTAALVTTEGTTVIAPALNSWWLAIHVTIAAASEAFFAIACAASIIYLFRYWLEKKHFFQKVSQRLPTLETLDSITYRAISAGYPLFTIGALFAGAIWAFKAWGRFWGWDPKETCSLIVWILYSIYLHARFVKGWSPHRLSWLAIAGFISALLTIFSSLILGGLHSYL